MYFYASKLFWLVFPPLNITVILMILGSWAGRGSVGGRAMLSMGWALLVLFGMLPTGKIMLHYLEDRYPAPGHLPAKIDGILVMGGAFDVQTSMARHMPTLYGSAERVTEATRLMMLYPDARLVYSGGNGSMDDTPSETEVFKAYLAAQHISDKNVHYENQSRNSYENILFSLLEGRPADKQSWLVVTSAAHMPRTIAIMRQQGWPGTIIPDPVDFQTTGGDDDFTPDPNILGNFSAVHLGIREWIALIVYRIGGKTESVL